MSQFAATSRTVTVTRVQWRLLRPRRKRQGTGGSRGSLAVESSGCITMLMHHPRPYRDLGRL